ncbi:MAG: PQQ-dependent sugar dehydrogenase, partial [Paracoccaceae bacterium]|nr:PQQ-dependent sugar dehydrogenase [Paracoccaceae bacterium]
MSKTLAAALAALASLSASTALAQSRVDSSVGPLTVTPVAEGLEEPWAIGFLPDGSFLVTELDGRLKHFPAPGGEPVLVDGVP